MTMLSWEQIMSYNYYPHTHSRQVLLYKALACDVTAAILVFQNKIILDIHIKLSPYKREHLSKLLLLLLLLN